MKDNEKVVDLEAEEGAEDINAKGMEPISKFPDYVASRKRKVKVTKDPYVVKFLINASLLTEGITFEGSHLVQILH